MTAESIFLILAISSISLVLIYEIVFILFLNNNNKKDFKEGEEDVTDMIVQTRPLGYSAPPPGKIQQCSTPVFKFSEVQATEANPVDEVQVQEEIEIPSAKNIHKISSGKPPTIVVSSPTS